MEENPKRVIDLRGRVIKDTYAKGSKSEHSAFIIETANGRYVLRRKTGPAFADPKLLKYVDHQVSCNGFLLNDSLLAEEIKIIK